MSEKKQDTTDRARDRARKTDEAKQRQQQQEQQEHQRQQGTQFSPPPYEVPETPLERLGPGFGYLFGVLGGAFLLNLLVLAVISGSSGG